MDSREALRRLSKQVPNRGVVVAESNKGHCNVGCDGDGYEILNAITHLMDSYARNTGTNYFDVAAACNEIRVTGFEEFLEKYREDGKKPVIYQGVEIGEYDPQAEKTAEDRCKALESQVKTLQSEIKRLGFEISSKDGIINSLKDKAVEVEKRHAEQIKALQKELKAEQHKTIAPTLKDIKNTCSQYRICCEDCPMSDEKGCMVLGTPEDWRIE